MKKKVQSKLVIKDEPKKTKKLDIIVGVGMVLLFIGFLIYIVNYVFSDDEYVDIKNSNLIEEKNGYKDEYSFISNIKKKKTNKEKDKNKYIIVCEYEGEDISVPIEGRLYQFLREGEEVTIKCVSHYDKKGKLKNRTYSVESNDRRDMNGIVDVPDGYKKPEYSKVPGADYGDGIVR